MTNEPIFAFISMPGGTEWIVIGLVALLLFGKRLPEVARSLGQAFKEFKNSLSDQPQSPAKPADPQESKPPEEQK